MTRPRSGILRSTKLTLRRIVRLSKPSSEEIQCG